MLLYICHITYYTLFMSYVPHCTACKTIKNLMPKPYAVRKNKDGIVTSVGYMCRMCNTERSKRYRMTSRGKQASFEAVYRSIRKHPHKQSARVKVNNALKIGRLVRPNICSKCSIESKVDGHHFDYSRPLDVLWVCRACHADIHRIQ